MELRSRKTIALSRLISASIAVSIIASLGGPLVTSFAANPAKRVPRSVDVIPRPTDLRMGLAQVQYKGYFADNTNWFTNERYSSSVMGDITTSTSGLPVFDGSSDLGGKTSFSWTGYFIPDFTGEWQFQISSDDASYLWIGNDAIVNYQSNPGSALIRNGGIHTERLVAAKIYLIKDKIYPLRIQYGNDTNAAVFKFKFMDPSNAVWQTDFSTLLWRSSGGGYANNCTNFGLSYTLATELGYDRVLADVCKNNGNDPNFKNSWVEIKSKNRTSRELGDIPKPEGSISGLHEAKFSGYFAETPELLKAKTATGVAVRTTLPVFNNEKFGVVDTYMWSGYLVPDLTGVWTFKITSDDAALMWLGNDAIQNWMGNTLSAQISVPAGPPTEKTASINLKKDNVYPFRILYGNSGGPGTFNFQFKPPGFSSFQTNSMGLFFHTSISYCTNWGISYLLMPKYGYDQVVPNSNCKDYQAQVAVTKSKPQIPTITSIEMTSTGLSIQATLGNVRVTNTYLLAPTIGYSASSKLIGKIAGSAATYFIPITKLKNVSKININLYSSNEIGTATSTKKGVQVSSVSKSPTATVKPAPTKSVPVPKSIKCSKGDKSRTFAGTVCPPGWSK
jgi:hypothetical protein